LEELLYSLTLAFMFWRYKRQDDDIGTAAGFTPQPKHPVNLMGEMDRRDRHRHELDPDSKGPAASA
jgi:hypothetical protein